MPCLRNSKSKRKSKFYQRLKSLCHNFTKKLDISEKGYRDLIEKCQDAIIIHHEGRIIFINQTGLELLGVPSRKKIIGKRILDFVNPGYRNLVKQRIEQIKRTKRGVPLIEQKYMRLDGKPIDVEVAAFPFTYQDRLLIQLIIHSIAKRKKAEEILIQTNARLRALIEAIPDPIYFKDPKGRILVVNQALEKTIGLKKREIIGKTDSQILPKDVAKQSLQSDKAVLKSHKLVCLEQSFDNKGERAYFDTIKSPIYDDQGKILGLLGIAREITERKKTQQQLEKLNKDLIKSNKKLKQLTLKDPCTGLYNHRYLEEVIEIEFSRARRYVNPISAIMIDLDYFRSINDTYGHHFGDLVLKQLAGLLLKMVRRYDIVVRFGGEEFIIISPGVNRQAALNLAQRILEGIGFYNFGNKEHAIKLKLSIAVASYPEDNLSKGIELIQTAERILAKAKECGGNRAFSALDIKNGNSFVLDSEEQGSDVTILREKISRLTKQANEGLIEAIFAFAKAIESKDHYTGEHVERTVSYSTEIARALDLDHEQTENIRQASILHDLGKIGISEKILCKKSKLTRNEFEEIKRHPQIGADILRPIHFLQSIIPLILYHHARWDGQGYPTNLKGKEIPVGARIIAVADVYQALISDRAYRKALSKKKAMEIIKNGSGTQFDPEIVDVFLRILKKED